MADLFCLWHIIGYKFPDFTSATWYDCALFPKADDVNDPLELGVFLRLLLLLALLALRI